MKQRIKQCEKWYFKTIKYGCRQQTQKRDGTRHEGSGFLADEKWGLPYPMCHIIISIYWHALQIQ